MKLSSLFSADSVAHEAGTRPYFNVLVIYDTRATAIRAKEVFDRLLEKFWNDFLLQPDFWRFDVLQFAEAQDQVSWADVADIIVVAASEPSQIPPSARKFVDQVVHRKSSANAGAVVGLFEEHHHTAEFESRLRNDLQPFTKGLDFFIHEVGPNGLCVIPAELDDRFSRRPPIELIEV